MIWDTPKRGVKLIKEGMFWICNKGSKSLFWYDSWDGYPSIISKFPHLQPLCGSLTKAS